MAGYICIAMLEDPPYNMILAATEEEPEDWLEELPLPSHLLCYENFKDTKVILKQFIQRLKVDGITVKKDKAFSAPPHEVIRTFIEVRDEAVINDQLVKDMDDDDEGSRLYHLAVEYRDGSNKIIPDLKKAFKLFMQAAELGYYPAYASLALTYFHGEGVKKDLNESLKWAMRDIDSGGVFGYCVAANCFVEAGMKQQASDMLRRCFKERSTEQIKRVLDTYEKDGEKAVFWYREAAEQGYAEAQFKLGQMYYVGSGVEEDDEKAVFWYREAAEQGYAEAQYELGQMYYSGRGVEEDDEKAVFWYRKAAEQGYAEAQVRLGDMYRFGWGVEKDDKKAVFWYRKVKLGLMYSSGSGIEKDGEKAVLVLVQRDLDLALL